MNDLIERLEKATVADRALEAAIARTVGEEMPARDPVGWPPRYMESIDAAMTLVPEDAGWSVSDYKTSSCDAFVHLPDRLSSASGETPAIALCIAALKARALLSP